MFIILNHKFVKNNMLNIVGSFIGMADVYKIGKIRIIKKKLGKMEIGEGFVVPEGRRFVEVIRDIHSLFL